MSAWTDDELRRLGGAEELDIAAVRRNGELRRSTPIWVVQADDGLYVRAAYMGGSGWHRVARATGKAHISAGGIEQEVAIEDADEAVLDKVDAAHTKKYGRRYASIVEKINDAEHRATTLRLIPREAA
jgi:hypothetical protein